MLRLRHCVCSLVLLMGFVIFSGNIFAEAQKENKRPNIFFLFVDDWGRYASIYPENPVNTVIHTPAFDRLAHEGVRFLNAHVNAPSCTPSRSALFSGKYFYQTGQGSILYPSFWDLAIPSFPLLLEESGYRIGFTYKAWSPGRNPDAPIGGDRTRFDGAGERFNQFGLNVTQMVAAGQDLEAAKEEVYAEVLKNFEMFLAAAKNCPEESAKPFLYFLGPRNTHRYSRWPIGSGKALWGLDPDNLKGKMPKFVPDVPEIREDFNDYLGQVLALDALLDRFLKKLEEIGELDNTIIVASGDHGIGGFPRGKCNLYDTGTGVALLVRWGDKVKGGRTIYDFVNLMDLAPTFLEVGGLTPPDVMVARSILPLLLSDKEGQIDPTRDYIVAGRERHVSVARTDLSPYPSRAIRTHDFLYIRNFEPERWPIGMPFHRERNDSPQEMWDNTLATTRYTFGDMDMSPTKAWFVLHDADPQWQRYRDFAFAIRPGEELYDLRNDPDCLVNVADNPAYESVRKGLSERLMKILISTEDPRVTGDGMMFERPPFGGRNPN